MAEMIALTFSVAILYSLCQPVPQKERTFVCPKKTVSDTSMEGVALILAAGRFTLDGIMGFVIMQKVFGSDNHHY